MDYVAGGACSGALNTFLQKQQAADAVHLSDLSLAIIKLMGPGSMLLAKARCGCARAFGLATQDYAHRLLRTAGLRIGDAAGGEGWLANEPPPYSDDERRRLRALQRAGVAARKVERAMVSGLLRWR